jgi:YidC/Oxa1 family membrane protein insertase
MMKKLLKKDVLIIAALFGLMLAWGPFYQKFLAPPPPKGLPPEAAVAASNAVPPAAVAAAPVVAPAVAAKPAVVAPARARQPEAWVTLSNEVMRLSVSSHGACVRSVTLPELAMTVDSNAPVVLDFARVPALAYEGLEGFGLDGDFAVTSLSNGAAVRLEAEAASGLRLVRTLSVKGRYEVFIEDEFTNVGAQPAALPGHAMLLGTMGMLPGEARMSGVDFLGIDTYSGATKDGLRHWAGKRWFSDDLTLVNLFDEQPRRGKGCIGRPAMTRPLPASIREPVSQDVAWVAVKNKFFVQILEPQGGAKGCELLVERVVSPRENPANGATWDAVAVPEQVAAAVRFPETLLAAGERFTRAARYYAGPKELAALKPLGQHKKEVMDFGLLRWVCEVLVWSLTGLHALIPNYGVAIILLTLIVRVIFWPLTHKGTESMKRLQELQPKIKELQEKYRDKPQKLQQETMALYREHKVNPLGGCLPMLIQIPVFFALFQVLRGAVELRFAEFLWVQDLCSPENLFASVLPLPLNLLPLVMTATQIWQQKLTPATGDPMQQKMMMWMMPIMMLVFLYNMPSALVLYWTANQCMMIVQLYWQRRGKKA